MKLVQRYPLHFNSKQTYELSDTAIINTYEAWDGSGRYEYSLTAISPITSIIKQGTKSLNNIAWFFAFCAFIVTVFRLPFAIGSPFIFAFLMLAGVCVATYFLHKNQYEVFRDRNGQILFWIKTTSSGKEKDFVNALKSKLST